MHRILLAVSFALLTSVVGCAGGGEEQEEVGAEASEVNATTPITLKNFISHPRIKAVRDLVAKTDGTTLTETANHGCDGSMFKFEAGGKILKIVESGGEGGFEGETHAYYRENGKLLFLFSRGTDFTGENEVTTEDRVYFDEQGKAIFQAIRTPGKADRAPQGAEIYSPNESHNNPAEWFKFTACPGFPE